MDPYRTLGLAPGAPQEDVKRAYRKLASQLHPDRKPGDRAAEERFKEVNRAYAVLCKDPPTENSGFDFGFDFVSAFESIFRRSVDRSHRIAVPLSFEESLKGVRKRVRVGIPSSCPACGGDARPNRKCPVCQGSGEVIQEDEVSFSFPCGADGHQGIRATSASGREFVGVAEPGLHPVWERHGLDLRMRVPLKTTTMKPGKTVHLASPYEKLSFSLQPGAVTLASPVVFRGKGVRNHMGHHGDLWVYCVPEVPGEGGECEGPKLFQDWLRAWRPI